MTAPGMLPKPPRMMTAIPFMRAKPPMVGLMLKSEPMKPPATAARPQPKNMAIAEMRSMFIPWRAAPSLSWEMASIAWPVLVSLMKRKRPRRSPHPTRTMVSLFQEIAMPKMRKTPVKGLE